MLVEAVERKVKQKPSKFHPIGQIESKFHAWTVSWVVGALGVPVSTKGGVEGDTSTTAEEGASSLLPLAVHGPLSQCGGSRVSMESRRKKNGRIEGGYQGGMLTLLY